MQIPERSIDVWIGGVPLPLRRDDHGVVPLRRRSRFARSRLR